MNVAVMIEEILTPDGLVPVCASCGRIRDRKGRWLLVHVLPCEVSQEQLTHSLCPDCTSRLYPSCKV